MPPVLFAQKRKTNSQEKALLIQQKDRHKSESKCDERPRLGFRSPVVWFPKNLVCDAIRENTTLKLRPSNVVQNWSLVPPPPCFKTHNPQVETPQCGTKLVPCTPSPPASRLTTLKFRPSNWFLVPPSPCFKTHNTQVQTLQCGTKLVPCTPSPPTSRLKVLIRNIHDFTENVTESLFSAQK